MKRLSKGRSKLYRLYDGPWNGSRVPLWGDTMVFSVSGFKGRYIVCVHGEARWEHVL